MMQEPVKPMSPLRIGVNIITSNRTLRGADRYALELLRHLAALDTVNQYYVFYADWQRFVEDLRAPNFHFVRLVLPRHPVLKTLWQAFSGRGLARRHGLHLIHYTNPAPVLWPTCPTLVTVHDVAEFTDPEKYGWIRRRVRRLSVILSARAATRLIAVSNSTKEALQRVATVDPQAVTVIAEGPAFGAGAPLSETPRSSRQPLRLASPYLLYVGVIERTKQVEAIVRAFAMLDSKLRESHLLVLAGGEGNASAAVEAAVRETGLDSRVLFLGYVPEADLEALYKGASAFVYPSLVEGFGLPILEAFATGTAVIASDIPALAEVAGDGALLVPPRDCAALRDAMQVVLTDEALRGRLVTRGHERLACFSWSKTARETLALYTRTAGGPRGLVH